MFVMHRATGDLVFANMPVLAMTLMTAALPLAAPTQELKEGKTHRLARLAVLSAEAVRNTSTCAVEFVKTQADKHLPDSVKQQVRVGNAYVTCGDDNVDDC